MGHCASQERRSETGGRHAGSLRAAKAAYLVRWVKCGCKRLITSSRRPPHVEERRVLSRIDPFRFGSAYVTMSWPTCPGAAVATSIVLIRAHVPRASSRPDFLGRPACSPEHGGTQLGRVLARGVAGMPALRGYGLQAVLASSDCRRPENAGER